MTESSSRLLSLLLLLSIPIIIGLITGAALTSLHLSQHPDTDSNALTAAKLIQDGSPVLGDADAPVTILEWGDYQCTFCYKFNQGTLNTIKKDYIDSGKVNLIFKDYPLNGDDSVLAAEASHCASEQGRYWQYHDELYKNWGGERTGWITRESLERFADTVNLNLEEFNECLDSHRYQDMVITQYEFGREIGIDATPSFLIFNDQKVLKIRGNQPLEVFLRTFDGL